MKRIATLVVIYLAILGGVLMLTGCRIIPRDKIVRHPDAPSLVTDTARNAIRVSVYDAETNSLVDVGWVDRRSMVGWTLTKYDWESFIAAAESEE